MIKKTYILLVVVCCISALTNVGLAVPVTTSLGDWNEGDPGTTHQFWDFTTGHITYNPGDGYTATPDSVISPDPEAVVATISPGNTYNPELDLFVAKTYLAVSLELPNYEVLNPIKIMWIDIGGDFSLAPEDIAISGVGHGMPSTAYSCELIRGQGDADFGVIIKPNPELEKLTMVFGPQSIVDYIHVDTICTVPEPATICLLGLGALSLIRRK